MVTRPAPAPPAPSPRAPAARPASLVAAVAARARRRPAASSALVAALVSLNTLWNGAVLDDGWAVLDNPLVRRLDLAATFRADYGVGGPATVAGLYRPVATLSWALQYPIHGRAPAGYHAVNLLLHLAATALVVVLARRLVASRAPDRADTAALVAGLLFAVHPAHVEAVAPLVARTDLLAAVASLGALRLALWPGRAWRLAGAAALVAAGMLSKETAAVAPALYLLVAVALPRAAGLGGDVAGGRLRAAARAAATAAALAAGVAFALLLRPRVAIPDEARWFAGQPFAVVLATMTRVLAEYWRVLVLPVHLSTDFGYATRIPFASGLGVEQLVATLAWGALLLAGLLSLRRAPLVAVGLLWVFAALAPVSNLVPTGVLMAERFLYLASVGPCALAGYGVAVALERVPSPSGRRAATGAVAAVLAVLAALAVARNAEWRSPVTLFEADLRVAPRHPVVNNNLAVGYLQRGDARRALERCDVTIAATPGYWRAHVNRALALERLGDSSGAFAAIARAITLAPREASPRLHAGALLARRGEHATAVAQLAAAEQLSPADPVILLEAARSLEALGRLHEAAEKARRAAALDPASRDAADLVRRLAPRLPRGRGRAGAPRRAARPTRPRHGGCSLEGPDVRGGRSWRSGRSTWTPATGPSTRSTAPSASSCAPCSPR